jgi:small subunit ribosomal protein S1
MESHNPNTDREEPAEELPKNDPNPQPEEPQPTADSPPPDEVTHTEPGDAAADSPVPDEAAQAEPDEVAEEPKPADEPKEDFGALLEETSIPSETEVSVGDRVRGRIVSIGEVDAFVDFGGRSEASITATELVDEDGKERYKVGDEIEAIVASVEEGVLLTLSGRSVALSREKLREAFQGKIPVEGLVKQINKGGFEVSVSGARGFCPMSQIDSKFVESPTEYIGQKLSFMIIEWQDGGKNLVLSRRAILEEQEKKLREEMRSKIVEGAELDGVITRVQPFGVFVDLGGIEGLVHVSQLAHGRIDNPSDHFGPKQSVRVKVLKLENLGEAKERISLSIKELLPDPWDSEVAKFHEGSVVKGKIVGLANFGAFVQLAPGLDGLVHLSELSRRRINHPRDVVSEGQEVEVQIKEIDRTRRRISLAIQGLEDTADAAPSGDGPKVGDIVSCVVGNVKPFGVFVDIASSGPRLSGLIPSSETGEPRDANLHRKFPKGRKLEAEIINIDEKGRIRLSLTSVGHRKEKEGFESFQADRKQSQHSGTSLSIFADVLEKVKKQASEGAEGDQESQS